MLCTDCLMVEVTAIDHAAGYGNDHLRDPSRLRHLIGRSYRDVNEAARAAALRDLPQDPRCAPAPYRITLDDGRTWIVWGDGTVVGAIGGPL